MWPDLDRRRLNPGAGLGAKGTTMKKSKTFGALRASSIAALCAGGLALSASGCKSGEKSCGANSCGSDKSGEKSCGAEKKCGAEKSCGNK